MKEYFKKKLGEKLTKSIITGDTFFTKVYKRVYKIEILKVTNKLRVEVTSQDKVPSGFYESGTEKYFGEIEVEIGDKTKTQIINEIIQKCDHEFLDEYKIRLD